MRWRVLLVSAVASALAACSAPKVGELPPEKESVQNAVSSHVGDVSDCYTAALRRNYKLAGKLILEWQINPIGDAKDIRVIQSVEPKLDQCIVKKVENWAFSPPPDNKVARVRYPFVFSPVNDPMAGVKTKQFETVATPVDTSKKCPQIENEYAQLCVRDDSGECVLEQKAMGEMLQLMRASPKLPLSYLAEADKLLKNQKPTQKDAEVIIKHLAEDCWTQIHLRMWRSIFYTFKVMPSNSRSSEAKEVLGERTTGLEVHSPTLLSLTQDMVILETAIDSGFIKPSPQAKKELVGIRSRINSLRKIVNQDWGVKQSDDGAEAPNYVTSDPVKVVKLVRKELKAVRPLRLQLKDWSKKYWKKF